MKKYLVRIHPGLQVLIRHLSPQIKSKIRYALEEIGNNPFSGKPLKDRLRGLYSYRVSQYRIIYEIKLNEIRVDVVEIAERKVVYQQVAALLTNRDPL